MKALSVTQPWASVLCSGLKDVENRQWQAATAPGRILIHATSTKVPRNWENLPDDYVSAVKNARLMGNIPEYKDMPYGSIIGYVDCYQIVKDSESFWAQPDSFHWCVKDAFLFDEPIPDIKGVRGHLFDVDIDENNLPAGHVVELMEPYYDGDTIIMPASEEVMAEVEAGKKEIFYDLDVLFNNIFINPETGEVAPAKRVVFVCGEKEIEKEIETLVVEPYIGPEDKPVEYVGFDGTPLVWSYFAIILK